jgi:hypothetical protein
MKYNPATSTSSDGFSRNNSAKVLVNQHTGYMNDGRLVNKGRGPTKGNDGSCHHSGMSMTGHKPMAAAVPALPAQGSVRDNINRGPQVRNPGGTRAFDPKAGQNYKGDPNSINMGRGPTKGNMQ